MSSMIEAFLVAALAGMVAGVSVGWMNRKILKFKKHQKIFKSRCFRRPRDPSPDLDVNVEST